ncbi:hypothetical protein CY34DRAFT_812110, partial [Suillus luteus UH-Slu-Lm8-n1]
MLYHPKSLFGARAKCPIYDNENSRNNVCTVYIGVAPSLSRQYTSAPFTFGMLD